jgi:FkbM family methyltransferase
MSLKEYLRKTFVYNIYFSIWYYWKPKPATLTQIIEKLNDESEEIYFIEIGANLTDRNDHLSRFFNSGRWKGVLVEPQADIAIELNRKYASIEDIQIANYAIGIANEQKALYMYNFSKDGWVTSLSSFSKEQLLKHYHHGWLINRAKEAGIELSNNPENLIKVEYVNTITFQELANRYQVEGVNLLVVDTEGYDAKIIQSIDFSKFNITLVIFENRHLSGLEYRNSIKHLKRYGYKLFEDQGDTFAVL